MELGTLIRELGGGMWISAEIFILTLLFSLPLGLVVAFGRMSKIAPVRWISKLYISIMRRNTADAADLWWCISDLIICLECEFPQDIV